MDCMVSTALVCQKTIAQMGFTPNTTLKSLLSEYKRIRTFNHHPYENQRSVISTAPHTKFTEVNYHRWLSILKKPVITLPVFSIESEKMWLPPIIYHLELIYNNR